MTEAHTELAKRGYVVGGRVFGYRNHVVYNGEDRDGNPLRSHVERVIDPKEAEVVRRIFTLYDSGYGLKRIAKLLTSEHAPEPKHFIRKDGLLPVAGWSPSTVRAALTRETYRGVVIWNKTKKKNSWGKLAPTDRPESEWVRTSAEHLRIIDEQLWKRTEARRREVEGKAVRFESGRISGRPPKNAAINLLAGLATCGNCGGGLIVDSSLRKTGRVPEYVCHRQRANGGCTNTLRVPVADVNEAVLQAIEEHALTPEAIEQVIRLTERDDIVEQQAALVRERKDTETRISRLVAAIENGGDAASLVAKVRELEERLRGIDAEAASLQPIPRLAPAVIESRLTEWRRLLRLSVTQGRTVLQRILRGRVTFTPRSDADGYHFSAPTRFDKLFTGIACEGRPGWLAPSDLRGTDKIGVNDTLDSDYGRVLEVALKGWCARQDSNLWPTAPEAVALSS